MDQVADVGAQKYRGYKIAVEEIVLDHPEITIKNRPNERSQVPGPLLSFQVIADVHITSSNTGDDRAANLSNALKEMKELYPDTAGVFLLGDNTDNPWEAEYSRLMGILDNQKHNPIPYYPVIGNHDVRWLPGGFPEAEERFTRYFNRDKVYYDEWINGYHFIVLGTERDLKDDAYISDEQWRWFKEKLEEGSDPKRPIFVMMHQSLDVGFNESDDFHIGERDLDMKHLLAKYPQVIYMSGHLHNKFGTPPGQMYNEKYCTMIDVPSLQASGEGFYVEVYEDKVLLKGRDFINKRWIPEGEEGNYTISLPANIPITDIEEPTWPEESKLTVALDSEGSANLSWSEAEDKEGALGYEVLRNGVPYAYVNGGTTCFKDTKLFAENEYAFSVRAKNAEGRRSIELGAKSIKAIKNGISAGIPSTFDRLLIENIMVYIDFDDNYVDQSGNLSPILHGGNISYEDTPFGRGAKYDHNSGGVILGDIDYGNEDFTVSFWFNSKVASDSDGSVIVSNSRFVSRNNPGWVVAMTGCGRMWYNATALGGMVDDQGESDIVISNEEWQYITISTNRTNNKIDIYCNGRKKMTHDITILGETSLSTQFPTIIGKDGDGVNYGRYEFIIGDFFMSKVAVTDQEAEQMYNAYIKSGIFN